MTQHLNTKSHWVVIAAAGIGMRMGGITPKQYLPIAGKPMLAHTIDVWLSHPAEFSIVVVLHPEDAHFQQLGLDDPRIHTAVGGAARSDSVLSGLNFLSDKIIEDDWVLVHDAARPCLSHADIDRLMSQISDHNIGGLLALPVRDCLKEVNDQAEVIATASREQMWQAQTPQMFRYGLLQKALQQCGEMNRIVLDEAEAVELMGYKPLVVTGSLLNIKVTHPEDMDVIERYIA